jgi:hypothetical protein
MSSKPKLSFPESLVVWKSATKVTEFSRWLDSDLKRLENEFLDFVTVQSARRAAQAVVADICAGR